MTFGRPPAIPNSFVMQEMPLNVDLEALDELANQSPALLPPQASHNSSTVIVYIESMWVGSGMRVWRILTNDEPEKYTSSSGR